MVIIRKPSPTMFANTQCPSNNIGAANAGDVVCSWRFIDISNTLCPYLGHVRLRVAISLGAPPTILLLINSL